MIADKRELFLNPALVCECITQWNCDSCRPHWSQHINPFVKQHNFGAQRAIIINESFFSLSQHSNFMRTIMMGVVISGGMQLASIKWVVSGIIFNVQCSPYKPFQLDSLAIFPSSSPQCVFLIQFMIWIFLPRPQFNLFACLIGRLLLHKFSKNTDDNTRLMRSERSMP